MYVPWLACNICGQGVFLGVGPSGGHSMSTLEAACLQGLGLPAVYPKYLCTGKDKIRPLGECQTQASQLITGFQKTATWLMCNVQGPASYRFAVNLSFDLL